MTPVPAPDRRGVAIVILTWNALAHTRRCLTTLLDQTDHPAWRAIVVDNGSTDGTVEWLSGLDGVTVVENGHNLGYSRACNIGLGRRAPDEDAVLMNNDVLITDRAWLRDLQDAAMQSDDVGVVGARLVDEQGRVSHVGTYMPPLSMWGQELGGTETDLNQCRRDRTVEGVVFAQAYLRRECLGKVGLLDEDFFAYFEDSDYCLRAQQAGFRVVFTGRVCSIHTHGVTTRENSVDFKALFERSGETFKRKWAKWLEHDRYEGELVWHSVVNRAPGYALQSRKLMTALHFAGMRVSYREAFGMQDGFMDDVLLRDLLRRQVRTNVPQVAFCQADVFHRVRGRCKVGWSMLEVTGLPREWVDGCNGMDEVWVPASFNLETFRRSGVRVPMRVMPLGVDIDYFHPAITGFRASGRFTFLSVFEWGERKAAEVLLGAFASEFDKSEDVMLLLSVYNRDPDVDPRREIARLNLPPSAPVVVMVNPEFAAYQMGALYRSADCFVLPTRGEGWGMPVLEAMACGVPAIATDWSGPADFLHEGVGYPLRVKSMIPAVAKCPYYEGFEWAEPDGDHLRFLLRHVVENQHEAQAKGGAAAAAVAANYTLDHAAARVKKRVLELS